MKNIIHNVEREFICCCLEIKNNPNHRIIKILFIFCTNSLQQIQCDENTRMEWAKHSVGKGYKKFVHLCSLSWWYAKDDEDDDDCDSYEKKISLKKKRSSGIDGIKTQLQLKRISPRKRHNRNNKRNQNTREKKAKTK